MNVSGRQDLQVGDALANKLFQYMAACMGVQTQPARLYGLLRMPCMLHCNL